MEATDLDTLLIHIPENIYYLTGHQTVGYYAYQCLAVPMDGDPVLSVRGLERDLAMASSWLPDDCIVGYTDVADPTDSTIGLLRTRGLLEGKVGIERNAWFLDLNTSDRLASAVSNGLADGTGLVEACRVVKSPAEISSIRRAAHASDEAMNSAIATIRPGVSERQVAAAMYSSLIGAGSEYISLPLFVASGPRSGLGHATWSDRVIEQDDVVFLETCGAVDRYSAAMIRTVIAGDASDEYLAIEGALVQALEAAMSMMRAGVPARDVDAACRAPVVEAGFGQYFTHRAGYSVGINFPPDWGEGHIASLRSNSEFLLADRMVFHVIPAVIIGGRVGIGISETILVTETGGEPLGSIPRQVFVS